VREGESVCVCRTAAVWWSVMNESVGVGERQRKRTKQRESV